MIGVYYMPNIGELQIKASQGDADAQFELGACYFNGDGVEQNREKGVRWFIKAADNGLRDAQSYVGTFYAQGSNGLAQNPNEAARYWEMAADQGFVEAQFHLGSHYDHGSNGFSVDIQKAILWYKKADEADYLPKDHPWYEFCTNACFALGNIYHNGKGDIGENPTEAYKWFKKAAERGNTDAQRVVDAYEQNGWHRLSL
jgi:hypothetical protein